jgi:hypothetical protein
MMDWQQAFIWGLGLAIAGVSWYVRGMVADLKELQNAISAHRLHVSEMYTKRTEIDAMRTEMSSQFTRLHERLDEALGKR